MTHRNWLSTNTTLPPLLTLAIVIIESLNVVGSKPPSNPNVVGHSSTIIHCLNACGFYHDTMSHLASFCIVCKSILVPCIWGEMIGVLNKKYGHDNLRCLKEDARDVGTLIHRLRSWLTRFQTSNLCIRNKTL